MQYTAIFQGCKNVHFQMKNYNIFLIFAQIIDCGYPLERLSEAVLTSTHNLCFGAKIRKNVYPCKPQFYYIKVGCKGAFVTRTSFRDVSLLNYQRTEFLFLASMFYAKKRKISFLFI